LTNLDAELRAALVAQAKSGSLISYGELARRLSLRPPQTIHRLTQALERLMDEDAVARRPLMAALCTSKTRPGLPAPGFFLKAQALGRFNGDPADPSAQAFHHDEAKRAFAFYSA
jgi:hypothetical protein